MHSLINLPSSARIWHLPRGRPWQSYLLFPLHKKVLVQTSAFVYFHEFIYWPYMTSRMTAPTMKDSIIRVLRTLARSRYPTAVHREADRPTRCITCWHGRQLVWTDKQRDPRLASDEVSPCHVRSRRWEQQLSMSLLAFHEKIQTWEQLDWIILYVCRYIYIKQASCFSL